MAPITCLWLWLGDLKSDRVLCWGWAGSRNWRRGCWSQGRDDSDLSNSGVSAWSPLASDSVTIHWNNMIQLTDIHPALERMMMSFYWPAPVLSISWWQHWQCSTDHRHVITPVSALLLLLVNVNTLIVPRQQSLTVSHHIIRTSLKYIN